MIIHYIGEEPIFVVMVYMLLLQKIFERVILKVPLKLIVNKLLTCKKENMLNSKILGEK